VISEKQRERNAAIIKKFSVNAENNIKIKIILENKSYTNPDIIRRLLIG